MCAAMQLDARCSFAACLKHAVQCIERTAQRVTACACATTSMHKTDTAMLDLAVELSCRHSH
eukprot:10977-Heterococcus_DN1.PRE.2